MIVKPLLVVKTAHQLYLYDGERALIALISISDILCLLIQALLLFKCKQKGVGSNFVWFFWFCFNPLALLNASTLNCSVFQQLALLICAYLLIINKGRQNPIDISLYGICLYLDLHLAYFIFPSLFLL